MNSIGEFYIPRLDRYGNVDANSFNDDDCLCKIIFCYFCKEKIIDGKGRYCRNCLEKAKFIRKKDK